MAEKSLFFNALPSSEYSTGYDRNYNADDISDWLSVVWDNGVVKGGLNVTAGTGMTVNLNVGRAAIQGKAYINNAITSFTVAPNGIEKLYSLGSIPSLSLHILILIGIDAELEARVKLVSIPSLILL